MNTPDEVSVDVEFERNWMVEYRRKNGLSWKALARVSNIPEGTLSPFCTGIYKGNAQNAAVRIFKFRQQVESQQEISNAALKAPDFIPTPTAMRIRTLLAVAQSGTITMACTAPGLGKSITAKHFRDSVANVWLITCRPTKGGLSSMLSATLGAIGNTARAGGGWSSKSSDEVITLTKGRKGLLVYDEANFLTMESLEEIRGIQEEANVGVCLLGNEELFARVRGGARNHQFARLNRRIRMAHLAEAPEPGDVDAFLDAWGIEIPSCRDLLTRIAMTPGSGGLGEISQIIEVANTLAFEDGVALQLSHLKDAQSTRTTSSIGAHLS